MSCETKLDGINSRLNTTNAKLNEQKTNQDKMIQILNAILKVLAGYTK